MIPPHGRYWVSPQLGHVPDREAPKLYLSCFKLGLVCGIRSGSVVLHVTTRAAQERLDSHGLPLTPHWHDGYSRYYMFEAPAFGGRGVTEIFDGAQLWGDGLCAIYLGSMWDDGRLVHWEADPECVPAASLPDWLWITCAARLGNCTAAWTDELPIGWSGAIAVHGLQTVRPNFLAMAGRRESGVQVG